MYYLVQILKQGAFRDTWQTIASFSMRSLAMKEARDNARNGIRVRVIKSKTNPIQVHHKYNY